MRVANRLGGAILQRMRQGNRHCAHCSCAKRRSIVHRWARTTAYSTAGQFVAGQWDSAFRGSWNYFYSRPGIAVPDGLGNGRALRKLAVRSSAVWTLWDRGDPGVLWYCASALGMGAISTRALGAAAWLGAWIFGAAAATVWHRARHLHDLGAAAAAISAGV